MIDPLLSTALPAAFLGTVGVTVISGAAVSFPAALAWFVLPGPGRHGTRAPVSICRAEGPTSVHPIEERL